MQITLSLSARWRVSAGYPKAQPEISSWKYSIQPVNYQGNQSLFTWMKTKISNLNAITIKLIVFARSSRALVISTSTLNYSPTLWSGSREWTIGPKMRTFCKNSNRMICSRTMKLISQSPWTANNIPLDTRDLMVIPLPETISIWADMEIKLHDHFPSKVVSMLSETTLKPKSIFPPLDPSTNYKPTTSKRLLSDGTDNKWKPSSPSTMINPINGKYKLYRLPKATN